MKIHYVYATTIFLGFFIPLFAKAVECGDTITAPTTLTEELICDVTDADQVVLTVEGPSGSLDMNGYRITCIGADSSQSGTGILLSGTSAQIYNGMIFACTKGIVAKGNGSHSIYSMMIEDSYDDIIYIETNHTVVKDNTLIGSVPSTGDGIDIQGDFNTVTQNFIAGGLPDSDGIKLNGVFNNISHNDISGYLGEGIEVNGQFTNVFSNTISTVSNGIAVGGGNEDDNADFSIISQNHITSNFNWGIPVRQTSNTVITQNTVEKNSGGGIGILDDNSELNKIIDNISQDNSDLNSFDLEDESDPGDCTGPNTWRLNTFDTANPSCLK